MGWNNENEKGLLLHKDYEAMGFFFWCFGFQFAVHTAQEMTKNRGLAFLSSWPCLCSMTNEFISLAVGTTVQYSTIVVCRWIRVTNRSTRWARIVENTLRTKYRNLSTGSDRAGSPCGSRCASRIFRGSAIRPLAQIVV